MAPNRIWEYELILQVQQYPFICGFTFQLRLPMVGKFSRLISASDYEPGSPKADHPSDVLSEDQQYLNTTS